MPRRDTHDRVLPAAGRRDRLLDLLRLIIMEPLQIMENQAGADLFTFEHGWTRRA